MALFKGDILIAGTNPSGGGAGGGHVIQDSTGVEFEQRPALQFIGADVIDDETNSATQVITPSFREIQGDIPDTNLVCLDGIPIGGIIPYGAPINTLSQDWLPCLGQAVSRTFYHELFEKYGTIYGDGDGSTTFNLPNYGGRVPVGLAKNDTDFDTLGATLGEKKHTLTVSEIPSHYHDLSVHSGGNTAAPIAGVANTSNASGSGLLTNSNFRIQNTGGGQSHNNIQPSIVANYIVKAKTSSHTITTSNVMTVHNESDENTYSTNYINELVTPDISTDSNGWIKYETPHYTKWYKKGTDSRQMNGNSWGSYGVSSPPVDLVVDSNTFFSGGTMCGDGAMGHSIGMNSDGRIFLSRYWHYTSTVTLAVLWYAEITKLK